MGTDTAVIRRYLLREIATLQPDPNLSLWTPLCPDSTLIRLNLRRYLSDGGDPEKLIEIMVCSARIPPDMQALHKRWRYVGEWIEHHRLPFGRTDFTAFSAQMDSANWPIIHHSRRFVERYRPAYRVLRRDCFRQLQ